MCVCVRVCVYFFFPTQLLICNRVYKGGKPIAANPNLDYAANYAHMLGFQDQKMHELMRLYITIHRYVILLYDL